MTINNFKNAVAKKLGAVKRCAGNVAKSSKRGLAASIVTGGLLFAGQADAANIVGNGGFEANAVWANQGTNYTHPYVGINGPQLTAVGTLNDYGFNDNLSDSALNNFHGLAQPTSQSQSLVNGDLTAAQILAGQGRFAFSAWLAACCNDTPKITATFNDAGSTSIVFNRGIATDMLTTADILVNPGGPDNATSQGVVNDVNRRYWALYESKGVIPTDATDVSFVIADGRADAAAAGANVGGNGNDNYVDMVIFDAVAAAAIPEPGTIGLLGLGALGLLGFGSRRRRNRK